MIVYILELLIICLLGAIIYIDGKPNARKNRVFIDVSMFLLFILEALRSYKVGLDTEDYIILFEKIGNGYETRWEFLYVLLNKAIWRFSHNSQWLLVIISGITIYGIRSFIKNNVDKYESAFWPVFFFVTLNFYFVTMSSLRQACALAIGVNVYTVMKKGVSAKSVFKGILLTVLSMMFHSSGVITVLIVPLFLIRSLKRRALIYTIFGSVVIFFGYSVLMNLFMRVFPRFQVYLSRESGQAVEMNMGNYVLILLKMLVVCGVYYSIPKIKDKTQRDEIIRLSILVILSIVIAVMKTQTRLAIRLGYYYDLFTILLIPKFVCKFPATGRTKFCIDCVLLVMGWGVFIVMMLLGSRGVVPYLFFWQ